MHVNYLGNVLAKLIMGCSIQHKSKEHCGWNFPKKVKGPVSSAHLETAVSDHLIGTADDFPQRNNTQVSTRSSYVSEAKSA